MKLEEGMYIGYVRGAINGYVPSKIAKVTDCSDKDLIKIDNGQVILRNDILKASYNIIDLIEEGDYVNGYKTFEKDDYLWIERLDDHEIPHFTRIDYLDIKSIVTKEQMESMAYEAE